MPPSLEINKDCVSSEEYITGRQSLSASCFLYFQRVNCQHSLLAHVRRNAWLFMQTVFESLIGASVGWAGYGRMFGVHANNREK